MQTLINALDSQDWLTYDTHKKQSPNSLSAITTAKAWLIFGKHY